MKGKKYIYAHKFEGLPKLTDLQLVEEELPPVKDGGGLCPEYYQKYDPYCFTVSFRACCELNMLCRILLRSNYQGWKYFPFWDHKSDFKKFLQT